MASIKNSMTPGSQASAMLGLGDQLADQVRDQISQQRKQQQKQKKVVQDQNAPMNPAGLTTAAMQLGLAGAGQAPR